MHARLAPQRSNPWSPRTGARYLARCARHRWINLHVHSFIVCSFERASILLFARLREKPECKQQRH
jgi:hypothetical protein